MPKTEFQKEVAGGLVRQIANLRKFMNAYSMTICDNGVLTSEEYALLDKVLCDSEIKIDKYLNKE